MKKILFRSYGGVEVLEHVDAAPPEVQGSQLLVAVKAVGINPLDWKVFDGQMKILTGSKFPKGVGFEFAGVVLAVGTTSSPFRPGDEVFGTLDPFTGGALAEQIAVNEDRVFAKPASLTFAQGAALAVGGLSALQIVDELAAVAPGQEVLVNGATGGVGAFVTQLAKRRGGVVTAMVSSRGIALAEKWGCDHVVDYARTKVTSLGARFDVVIDLSDRLPFSEARTLLKPRAVYVGTLPSPQNMIAGFFQNLVSSQKRKILSMKSTPAALSVLAREATAGLDVVVGATYPMSEVQRAYRDSMPSANALGKPASRVGKVVLEVG